eukprot:CAMPEP_0181508834 /NCGR_PEP_ID=MMETSP1110-20121109/59986_1 /TAXON_ID=174948 /ORGANISM="Symbiodinium sp., Strain CCMP421" /LENGTH=30 /DNA_ID= /DNA_START= /DNA_END= /DNA_ORIENTATION=
MRVEHACSEVQAFFDALSAERCSVAASVQA